MTTEKNEITTEITCCCQEAQADLNKLRQLVCHVCERLSVKKALVSVAIVDDDSIRQINRRFLNRDERTDVISFDLSERDEPGRSFELLLNADEAERQARTRGHSTEAELALYLTHGMLHNLGFDDADETNAQKMHDMEDDILHKAGFGIVYNRQRRTN